MKDLIEQLQKRVSEVYENGTTVSQSEEITHELADAEFKLVTMITPLDLDARMRRHGVKQIRAAVYLDIIKNSEKKPTEAQIAAMVDSDSLVSDAQKGYDGAEAALAEAERLLDAVHNSQVVFRTLMKESSF
jgi:hypothetical protein